jgi:hypothetical protein
VNATVASIQLGSNRRYKFHAWNRENKTEAMEFDGVVIAAPLHSNGIKLDALFMESNISRGPRYLGIHVTHFVPESRLSPKFFSLPNSVIIPNDILTTAALGVEPSFFSITYLNRVHRLNSCNTFGDWECDVWNSDYLYRIEFPRAINDSDIVAMICKDSMHHNMSQNGISWVH